MPSVPASDGGRAILCVRWRVALTNSGFRRHNRVDNNFNLLDVAGAQQRTTELSSITNDDPVTAVSCAAYGALLDAAPEVFWSNLARVDFWDDSPNAEDSGHQTVVMTGASTICQEEDTATIFGQTWCALANKNLLPLGVSLVFHAISGLTTDQYHDIAENILMLDDGAKAMVYPVFAGNDAVTADQAIVDAQMARWLDLVAKGATVGKKVLALILNHDSVADDPAQLAVREAAIATIIASGHPYLDPRSVIGAPGNINKWAAGYAMADGKHVSNALGRPALQAWFPAALKAVL